MTYELWNTATANRIGSFTLSDLASTLEEIVEMDGPGAMDELVARIWLPGSRAPFGVLGPDELKRFAHRNSGTRVVRASAPATGPATEPAAAVFVWRRAVQVG